MRAPSKTKQCHKQAQQPVLLCLDLNSDTSWAVVNHNGHVMSGVVSFQPRRFEQEGMRYFRFSEWLDEIHSIMGRIDAIYIKKIRRPVNVDNAQRYGGLLGALTLWCEQQRIPYHSITQGIFKKFISGNGNASKQSVTNAVYALGYNPQNDNESHAIALLHYACAQRAINTKR